MSRIDPLLKRFQAHATQPLKLDFPLSQRVWFVVYPPDDERKILPRIPEFELIAKDAGLDWVRVDLTGSFAAWIDTRDDKEELLGDDEIIETYADPDYIDFIKQRLISAIALSNSTHGKGTLYAVTGLMELYDFVHVSSILDSLDSSFPGVLVLFFPGERENNSYRFLSVRDGWDYLAVPILPED